ncbi:Ditrans,polycis-polyprenyl diphosphate synthase ((2E,6E)-farnesyl diphosphate specific) [Bertholletia excelsa]
MCRGKLEFGCNSSQTTKNNWLENPAKMNRIMDFFADDLQRVVYLTTRICNLILLLLWYAIHFFISVWYFALNVVHALESYCISSGLLKRYKSLNLENLQYLAVVIDSEDAGQTSKVIKLLLWLAAIGVKNICLYDPEGILKKSQETIMKSLQAAKMARGATKNLSLLDQIHINLEIVSASDGKEAIVKAGNLLFVKNYLSGVHKEPKVTESHLNEALKAVGAGGPEPNLLLVYGPARCHLGFPAWRIRYTEIVHMGPLKSMHYGSLVKAIKDFTMVRQNFGK